MGRGKKGPMKITYSIQGRPIDLKSMQPDERKALAIKLNDVAMAAIGYERIPEKKDLKVSEGRQRVNADT